MSDRSPEKPASIRLGELAIAAGAAGRPVAICYRDFPAAILGDVWRYHARSVGGDKVVQILRPWDLNKLTKNELKLVFVPEPALRTAVAWILNLQRRNNGNKVSPCPALFSCCSTRSPEEDPGATLVLHGHPDEVNAVVAFLQSPTAWTQVTAKLRTAGEIKFQPDIERALNKLRRYRDREVVRGLLVGASVARGAADGQELVVCLAAYTDVFKLLQQEAVRSAEEPFDPLAVAMVNRANCYLKSVSADEDQVLKVARAEQAKLSDKNKENLARTVTRRELVNLGNPNSTLVRELIKHLLRLPDGYQIFRRLGLNVRLPRSAEWPVPSEAELAKLLRPWTAKQVRNRFDRLQKEGLITAERRPANGPWFYQLPDSLADKSCDFRTLPKPAELQSAPDPTSTAAADQQSGTSRPPAVSPPPMAAASNSEEGTSDENDIV